MKYILILATIFLASCSSFKSTQHTTKRVPSSNSCEGDLLESRIQKFLESKAGINTQSYQMFDPTEKTINFSLNTTKFISSMRNKKDNLTVKRFIAKMDSGASIRCNVLCNDTDLALNSCAVYRKKMGPFDLIL